MKTKKSAKKFNNRLQFFGLSPQQREYLDQQSKAVLKHATAFISKAIEFNFE